MCKDDEKSNKTVYIIYENLIGSSIEGVCVDYQAVQLFWTRKLTETEWLISLKDMVCNIRKCDDVVDGFACEMSVSSPSLTFHMQKVYVSNSSELSIPDIERVWLINFMDENAGVAVYLSREEAQETLAQNEDDHHVIESFEVYHSQDIDMTDLYESE